MLCAAVLLLVGAPGCGPEEFPKESEEGALESQSQELVSDNGFTLNGLSANGLSANGLSFNGLSFNGLSANGLASAEFASWFAQDPILSTMVMTYLVRCAVPAGQSRSYTDAETGQSYSWNGALGLTPGWSNGQPASFAEQQVLTACLLAHVNQAGANLNISVLGRSAVGQPIPFTPHELLSYPVQEACFFGNLFTQQGLFFGVDRLPLNGAIHTRACTVSGGSDSSCAPIEYAGSCWQHCQADLLAGPSYKTCTYNGVTYRALSTRMRRQDFKLLASALE
ncbi:hypothetical protein [Hyalangium rubrum]|uniref:Lipoprotein n=1 Tax=Hyalangium rubrum TaxID=3103134 RepID=A0ABU5H3Z8_9BACT|nr:hypothetical protein [Hyalangium sp. s54d21]MDY7228184.1 hypothetical protein [Hyalangium sp. s54d21]